VQLTELFPVSRYCPGVGWSLTLPCCCLGPRRNEGCCGPCHVAVLTDRSTLPGSRDSFQGAESSRSLDGCRSHPGFPYSTNVLRGWGGFHAAFACAWLLTPAMASGVGHEQATAQLVHSGFKKYLYCCCWKVWNGVWSYL